MSESLVATIPLPAGRTVERVGRDRGANAAGRPPFLTPRQRDCVLLVAKGYSDEEIAGRLGISKQTAHKHVEAAKLRFRVTTRTRLVVDALFTSELSFAAIFADDGWLL